MINIKLKNTTTKAIALPTGADPIEIAAGKDAAIPLDVVTGPDVATHLATGALELPRTALADVAAADRPQATAAIGDVVLRLAPRFLGYHDELEAALGNLNALRDRYNQQHATAVRLLTGAKAMNAGVTVAITAADLLSATEDDAVSKAEQALAAHLGVVPKKEELALWYEDHKRLEAVRDKATRERDSVRSVAARQLAATREQLDAAAVMFAAADPKKVGAPVNWGA
ncbi:MAG: hypothetical protein ACKV2T_00795 [Kofleriaceae bacterium]